MSMVEFGNNLDPDEEFDVLHSILDFPMECLEEDEDAEDWDISNPECLGPIPSNVLMGLPMMSDEKFNFQRPNLFPRPVAPIAGVPELKQGLHIPPWRRFAKVQESPSFRTQSPVSVLESSGSHLREKRVSIKSDNVIPVRSRSKRVRYAGINPWLLAGHGLSTSKQTPNARRSRESSKILSQQPVVAMDLLKNSPRSVDNLLGNSDPPHLENISKKCSHCQSTNTPQWRWGPLGKNSLCNACGVRYRSGCLFPEYRPAASPTFAQSQHSNSHKKVTEMRIKANLSAAKIKIHVGTSSSLVQPQISGTPREKQLAKHVDTSSSLFRPQINRAPEQMQLVKHTDTSSSLIPQQIVGAPEREQLAKHIDTFVGVPDRKQLAKHVDTSCSRIPSQIAGTAEREQLSKHVDTSSSIMLPHIAGDAEREQLAQHVDTSCSLIYPQIAGVAEQKQLAKHVGTSCSLIPPQTTGVPEQKQLAEHVDTSCSPSPPQNAGAPKQMWLVKHINASSSLIPSQIVGAPEQMLQAKHIVTSSSLIPPQMVGAPEKEHLAKHVEISCPLFPPQNARASKQKQLAKHIDTSGSLISPQIVRAPKRKKLAKYDDTCGSHIPLHNKHASVPESGAFCAENSVSLSESKGSCLRERWSSFMSSKLERVKPAGTNPSLLASPSTCKKTSNASKGKESRVKLFQLPVAMNVLKNSPKNEESSLDVSDPASLHNASKHGHARTKKCAHCQSTKTPQWREGPLGPRTLCNACGVRYRSGRLVPEYRPVASPTFVPSKHSNLHSEVVQMIKAEHTSLRPGVKTKVPLTSPQPEFVP